VSLLPDDERAIVPIRARDGVASAPPGTGLGGGNTLPRGTRLGEFEITGLVGEGGFGIVYLAHDHVLGRDVALKEYMPSALAARSEASTVVVRAARYEEPFQAGLRSFINEARLLARFDHPSLVKVYRFWGANGTAYMVMPFYEGITLKVMLKNLGQRPDEVTPHLGVHAHAGQLVRVEQHDALPFPGSAHEKPGRFAPDGFYGAVHELSPGVLHGMTVIDSAST